MLVDDHDGARASVRDALESAGHAVIEAANGQQALNFLVSRPDRRPALIILDLQMPVMDGWQFIELVKCYVKLSKIPIIIATAQDPHLERISHRAVLGCIRLPCDPEALLEMVDECLDPDSRLSSNVGS